MCCEELDCTGGLLPSLLALCWLMQCLSIRVLTVLQAYMLVTIELRGLL